MTRTSPQSRMACALIVTSLGFIKVKETSDDLYTLQDLGATTL